MNLRNTCGALVAVAGIAGAVSSASAMVWTQPNVADANTIALYHFDEGAGTSTSSTVAGRPNINLSSGTWSGDVGWLASPSGSSLTNAGGTNGSVIGTTASAQSVNWGLPGITVSFWMKDSVNFDRDNTVVYMGLDGWKNLQSIFGYHTQWGNAVLMQDGVGGPARPAPFLSTIANGQWHHVGLVFDNATDVATLYIDNAQQLNWSTAGGLSSVVTEIMTIGTFGGTMDELIIQGSVVTDFSNGMNAVPEPTALAMLGAAGLFSLRRRRNRA